MAGHCKFMATYGVVEYLCYPWVNVLIALERVVMMAYPLNSKSILTLRNKIIAMGIFYAFCAAFLVRAFLYSELTVSAVGRTKCNPGYFWVQSFLPISFTNFILPFVCQIVCYSVIALHIQKTSHRSNVTLVQIRLTKLFFADAIIFFASNLPHQLAMYMDEFGDPLTQSSKVSPVCVENFILDVILDRLVFPFKGQSSSCLISVQRSIKFVSFISFEVAANLRSFFSLKVSQV